MQLGPIQKEWIAFLKENPQMQGRSFLGIKNEGGEGYKACCLGQLLLTSKLAQFSEDGILRDSKGNMIDNAVLRFSWVELGLRSETGKCSTNLPLTCLTIMNDTYYTWPQIAEIVEKNPEAYFTKSY